MNPVSQIPFLISIPHGGTQIPVEIQDRVIITPKDLFDDSDSFTNEIYDVGERVRKVIKTNIARAFVDLSRSFHQMPPEFPDGLIKSCTCFQKPIYQPHREPDAPLQKMLIQYYYKPYHHEIRNAVNSGKFILGLDCHSMLPIGPPISPDAGKSRPLINLGNLEGKSCSHEWLKLLADCFQEVFKMNEDEISMNFPFKGGFITQKYGQNPIPWIQIEMNRSLYLTSPWFDAESLKIEFSRLENLNRLFDETIKNFYSRIKQSVIDKKIGF